MIWTWERELRQELGSIENKVVDAAVSSSDVLRWLTARALLGEPLEHIQPTLQEIRAAPPTTRLMAEFAKGARLAGCASILREDPGPGAEQALAIANGWKLADLGDSDLEIRLGIHALLAQDDERRACLDARIRLPMRGAVETLGFEVLYQSHPMAAEDPLPLRTASLCRSACETLFSSPLNELSPHVLLLASLGHRDLATAMHEAFRVIDAFPESEAGRGRQERMTFGTPTLAVDSASGLPQLVVPVHGSGELHPAVWPLAPVTARLADTFETTLTQARARRSRPVQDLWKRMKAREPFHLDAVVRLDPDITFDHAWQGTYARRFRVAFENICHLMPCPPGESRLRIEHAESQRSDAP